MRIVKLTPGTGNFYCGSCIRDNALANAMRAAGHDVMMVPMYLPHVLDEPEAALDSPVFFGGVNVYLQEKIPLFRHTPRWVDRLFDAPWLLRYVARFAGMTRARDLGEMTVSMLQGEHGRQNKELTKLIAWLKSQGKVDAVCLSNAMLLGVARRIKQELGCAIICTLAGEDAFLDSLIEPYRSDAWQLLSERAAEVDAFIAVSKYYGDTMTRRMTLNAERVHVVYNGVNMEGYRPAVERPDPPVVGYLARMIEGKGLTTLVDAFIELKQRDRVPGLTLRVGGSMTGDDENYVATLKAKLRSAGLADDVSFHPNLSHDEKADLLRSFSVMSVPATYGESFGLYLLEAWACGVPVVQPRHAAFPELLDLSGAGILCNADDVASLADGLEQLLLKPDDCTRMGLAGRGCVEARFTIERIAGEVLDVIESTQGNRTITRAEAASP
ncbi:MAG: glycosyltransferase family 4 protein [Phycisphaeraceae bacterium]